MPTMLRGGRLTPVGGWWDGGGRREGAEVESFEGKLAVVTGGGSGIGRELVAQLAAAGCSVATCDVRPGAAADTAASASAGGVTVTGHDCDVADEAAVARFAAEVAEQHGRDDVHVLVNNAGIAGGGSFLTAPREQWERTFGVCWWGVYHCCRVFVPRLVAADEGWLVNVSSVNAFWPTNFAGNPHTAYSTAKAAVKGFSEAIAEDFRVNAPHVGVSLVMPGHIGTDIIANTREVHRGSPGDTPTPGEIAQARALMAARGMPSSADEVSDDDVAGMMRAMAEGYRDSAPVTAAEAATVILDGVRAGSPRILVGADAEVLDAAVREDPLRAFSADDVMTALAAVLPDGRARRGP
jgi:NAD(P)-dependent dehydrogenase (short-subunit alcohol dehydrogenase family)